MHIHSVGENVMLQQIDSLKAAHKPDKKVEQFVDPFREFSRASKIASTVYNWLTYSIEARKSMIREQFNFNPQMEGETDQNFASRRLERWRALNVIIQEESRAEAGNRSVEVAMAALKHLFPEHGWKTAAPAVKEKE